MKKITISLTFQGYEPEAFKAAFKSGWEPFQRPGIDDKDENTIIENSSEESDREEQKEEETKA